MAAFWLNCDPSSASVAHESLESDRHGEERGLPDEILSEHRADERRWSREVLRRGLFELLYLAASLAIVICALWWIYLLLSHAPAARIGAFLGAAAATSIGCYHLARWRANATMSRQVEKLIAWVIVTFGMALVWGAICCAFLYTLLRWIGVSPGYDWSVGGLLGLCSFIYMVASEWNGLSDCLALPESARSPQSDIAAA
jgi:hypothetical protein